MKKEVNVCDVCQRNIATVKCPVCHKDICPECASQVKLFIYPEYGGVSLKLSTTLSISHDGLKRVYICKDCSKTFDKYLELEDISEEFIVELLQFLKEKLKVEIL